MLKKFIPLVMLTVFLGGCASENKAPIYVNDIQISDPWEDYNRAIFKFNDTLDENILVPVAKGYQYVTPDFAEEGIGNALRNLRSPIDLGNQVLQGDFEGGLETLTRAVINTTFGIGGFIDLATEAGIPYEREDFGQTLAVWGVEHGPYIVVPLFGPASLRDHTAGLVDAYLDPVRLYLFNVDQEEIYYGIRATEVIHGRAQLLDVLADLKSSSIDYYAAVRSLYYQNREANVRDQEDSDQSMPDIPDY